MTTQKKHSFQIVTAEKKQNKERAKVRQTCFFVSLGSFVFTSKRETKTKLEIGFQKENKSLINNAMFKQINKQTKKNAEFSVR